MMNLEYVYDPKTKQKFLLNSEQGQQLIKKFIKFVKNNKRGGNNESKKSIFDSFCKKPQVLREEKQIKQVEKQQEIEEKIIEKNDQTELINDLKNQLKDVEKKHQEEIGDIKAGFQEKQEQLKQELS